MGNWVKGAKPSPVSTNGEARNSAPLGSFQIAPFFLPLLYIFIVIIIIMKH